MSQSTQALKVAAVQLAVGEKLDDNLRRAGALIDSAVEQGAGFVALPECFTGKYGVQLFASHREPIATAASENERTGSEMMAARARKHGVYITGGVIEEATDGKLFNSMPIFGPDGNLHAVYRKVHLSRVMGVTSESDVLEAGDQGVTVTLEEVGGSGKEATGVSVGMACCFDLRFPVFLSRYGPRVNAPVDCVCAPSAFLDLTGQEHWDLLIRRTALDGQCYVIAPDIAYDDQDGTKLHGRSAIVDPFGRILAQCDAKGDGLAMADVCRDRVAEVRAKLPLTLWRE